MTEATASTNGGRPTLVLVHGGFVDASGCGLRRSYLPHCPYQ